MNETHLRELIYTKLKLTDKDLNIDRLTYEQMSFITNGIDKPYYLEACPGSGKTEVVGIKAAFELIDWRYKFNGISIVSFTNNAAKEIEQRVKKYAGSNASGHPHFIGTLDSFLYNYVFCPFFHGLVGYKGKDNDLSPRAIIDERSVAQFLENAKYKPKTKYAVKNPNPNSEYSYIGIPITANRFYYDLIQSDFVILPTNDARNYITLSNFLERPEQVEYHKEFKWLSKKIVRQGFVKAKKSFWADGFLTFRDLELIVYLILKKNDNLRNNLVSRFPVLIIDECQDLSPQQILILDLLIKEGIIIDYVGDLNQSIYKFREVDPRRIKDFIKKNNTTKLKLTNNFRSNQKVVDSFAKIFDKNISGKETQYLDNCLYLLEYEKNQIEVLVTKYKKIIEEANSKYRLKTEQEEYELIKKSSVAIIIRGTTLLNMFKPYKTESKNPITILSIALQLWQICNSDVDRMNNSLLLYGQFLSKVFYNNEGSSYNQFCQEGISKLEWRIALSNSLDKLCDLLPFYNEKSEKLTYSKWAKTVRSALKEIYNNLPAYSNVKLEDIKLSVESGLSSVIVSDFVKDYKSSNKIRATTIHDIKGETLDSVLVVSSLDRKSKGGHWKDWFNEKPLNDDELEHKRYGYVALSRPKHLLVLATPKLADSDRQYFIKMGFKIQNLDTKLKPLF